VKDENYRYGICGVYCGQCPSGNGRVKVIAGELKRLVDTVRYDWVGHVVKSFKFEEFRKGLEWFADAQCAMCLNGGGAPCENRKWWGVVGVCKLVTFRCIWLFFVYGGCWRKEVSKRFFGVG